VSETTAATTQLTSQYSAQVTSDLERNVKEQERLSGEIEALQAQLAAVRHDHTVLVSIQQALGVTTESEPVAEPAATVPSPRKKPTATTAPDKQKTARKTTGAGRKRTAKKSTAKAPAAPSAQPTLVDLVREHLAAQTEPRSAAEVTTALAQQHPERAIKTTVVRTTLEGLVAKNHAQRSKQGTSVFYTSPDTADQTPAADQPA